MTDAPRRPLVNVNRVTNVCTGEERTREFDEDCLASTPGSAFVVPPTDDR